MRHFLIPSKLNTEINKIEEFRKTFKEISKSGREKMEFKGIKGLNLPISFGIIIKMGLEILAIIRVTGIVIKMNVLSLSPQPSLPQKPKQEKF